MKRAILLSLVLGAGLLGGCHKTVVERDQPVIERERVIEHDRPTTVIEHDRHPADHVIIEHH